MGERATQCLAGCIVAPKHIRMLITVGDLYCDKVVLSRLPARSLVGALTHLFDLWFARCSTAAHVQHARIWLEVHDNVACRFLIREAENVATVFSLRIDAPS